MMEDVASNKLYRLVLATLCWERGREGEGMSREGLGRVVGEREGEGGEEEGWEEEGNGGSYAGR